MRSVHTQVAQQTDSHVVYDTAGAKAELRSLELELRHGHMLKPCLVSNLSSSVRSRFGVE